MQGSHAARTVSHLEKLNHGVNTECRRHTVRRKSLIKLVERRGRGHEPKSCCVPLLKVYPNTPGKSSLIAANLLIAFATFTLIYYLARLFYPKQIGVKQNIKVRIKKSIKNLAQKVQQWICNGSEISTYRHNSTKMSKCCAIFANTDDGKCNYH